jgi:hypothetical protein
MWNRPDGLAAQEEIPKRDWHIVTHVPWSAVRFTEKAGTTDQHCPSAFCHDIGFGDDVFFPETWMDLMDTTEEPS